MCWSSFTGSVAEVRAVCRRALLVPRVPVSDRTICRLQLSAELAFYAQCGCVTLDIGEPVTLCPNRLIAAAQLTSIAALASPG
jgi:hypothetical protein